jgi:FAD/FMN-containing dehydrogenase
VSEFDFAVSRREHVASRNELAALLRGTHAHAVRLCGAASSLTRLPPPKDPVCLVSTARMDKIVRLEPDDLTCSVEPGVTRAQLDAALAPHGLVLPCPGHGTLGGLLARGEHQPLSPSGLSARHVVLGLEGVLCDGTPFKTGARVVKSVAGYDVHRAFVGSRGRLFAATLFHLKLRPAPAARLGFAQACSAAAAVARFRELRLLAAPPSELFLRRERDGSFVVRGVIEGAREFVDGQSRALGLSAPPSESPPDITCAPGEELVDGVVQPSAAARLLALLPAHAPVQVTGTGQFQAALHPAATDACLAALTALPGGCGEILCGAASRRGRATPLDPGAAQLEVALRHAFDPRGLLQ